MKKLRIFLFITTLLLSFYTHAQYCVPSVVGNTAGIGITNVTFNTINNTTPDQQGYVDYSALNTTLSTGASYILQITTTYSAGQPTMVWIDWNQNFSFNDPGEAYSLGQLPSGTINYNIYVPIGTALGNTRMRVASDSKAGGTPTSCTTTQAEGDIEDYTLNIVQTNMAYDSIQVSQFPTGCVIPPVSNKRIIGIEIHTSGTLNPLQSTQFTIAIAGTTNIGDITNAQLWYTANSNTFATTTLFGSAIPAASFVINGNQALAVVSTNVHYFWLTFDIVPGATAGNTIDAQCIDVTLSTVVYPVVNSNAIGSISISGALAYVPPPATYVWYMGGFSGIDFKCNPPQPLFDGKIDDLHNEGVSATCDANGDILIYTDGITVWNASHTVVTNGTGLFGHSSTCQSALIMPQPLNPNLYYIFTQDAEAGVHGFNYSIYDVSLNTITVKNQSLLNPATEQLTAVVNCNGTDYWVLVHGYNNNNFYVYALTPAGLNTTPVVSSVGPSINAPSTAMGFAKFSPDGKKLMVTQTNYNAGYHGINLFDFCSATGVVSNFIDIPVASLNSPLFLAGVSFSPNSSKVYYTENYFDSDLYQLDINAGNIPASRVWIGSSRGTALATLQNAPDGKIYISKNGNQRNDSLAVINNPDVAGAGCGFVDNGFYLGGQLMNMGLPNYPENYFKTADNPPNVTLTFTNTVTCLGDTTTFANTSSVTGTSCAINYKWNFGDPVSGSSDSSNAITPKHFYSSLGTYTVSLFLESGCLRDSMKKVFSISQPTVNIASNSPVCLGSNASLSAAGGISYLWSNGATGAVVNVVPAGNTTYTVTAFDNNGCTNSDTFQVATIALPAITVSGDSSICTGTSSSVTVSGGNSYSWQPSTGLNNNTSSVVIAAPTGFTSYTVTGTVGNGCSNIAVFSLTVNTLPQIIVSGNSSYCSGGTTTLSASGANNYSWTPSAGINSSTGQSVIVLSTGSATYTVTGIDANGCSNFHVVAVTVYDIPSADAGPSDTICPGETKLLTASGGSSYLWNTGSSNAGIQVSPSSITNYSVVVSNGNCSDSAYVTVFINLKPTIITRADTTIIAGAPVTLTTIGNGDFSWMPQTGLSCNTCVSPVATPSVTTMYYVMITDSNGCTSLDSVLITIDNLCTDLFIPNAFSPNEDGENDVFTVYGTCLKNFNLRIYDRWGNLIYQTSDRPWDGTFKGVKQNTDVFVYRFNGVLTNGTKVTRSGNISLLR